MNNITTDNGMTPDIALLDFACDDKNITECLAYYFGKIYTDYLACFIAADIFRLHKDFKNARKYYEIIANEVNVDTTTTFTHINGKEIQPKRKILEWMLFESYYHLGNIYADGKGVEQDLEMAMEYHRKSANLGNGRAYNNLGNIYFYGCGVSINYKRALEFYKKASDLDNANACFMIGWIYKTGIGVEVDCDKAEQYFKKAGDLGDKVGYSNYMMLKSIKDEEK